MTLKPSAAALLIASAFSAPVLAQSSVTLYGIVDASIRYTNNEGTAASGSPKGTLTRVMDGGMSESRLGFDVKEDMGNGLLAISNMEMRLHTDDGATTTPMFQQAWAGLQSSQWGRVTVGRQYNVLFDLVTSTYASYPYSPYFQNYKPEIGQALGARTNGAIKYTAEFGPVRAGLQLSKSSAPTGGTTAGGYVRYADGGLAAGAGYMKYEFGSGKKIDAWTMGGSYRTGPWYFNAGYGQNKVDSGLSPIDRAVLSAFWGGGANGGFGGPAFLVANKRELMTLGLGYQITPQLNLGGHYYYARQSGLVPAAKATAHFYTMAADYAFSKRTDVYLEVDRTTLSDNISLTSSADGKINGARSRTGVTVGMRHRF